MRDVCGPGEVGREMNPKELKALYPLYLLSVHVEGRELCAFRITEIHNQFLGFWGVWTPFCQMLNFLPAGWLDVVCYQSYDGHVISKFHDGVGEVDGGAVMGEVGVEEGTEDTPLCQCSGSGWMMCGLPSWRFVVCCWGSPVSMYTVNCLNSRC